MRVLSLGAGVQSSTLLLMACEGEIEKPDCAIFADTGWEPKAVYEWLEWLEERAAEAGIPIHRVSAGNIREDSLGATSGFAQMPFHITNLDGGRGMLRRQCTRQYKVTPIQRKIRELGATATNPAEQWIGISLDEVQRMKPSRVKYAVHRWPLIEQRMTRLDCTNWLERHGYQRPPKSSCIGCPFHDTRYWREMKDERPDEWQDAIQYDHAIRLHMAEKNRALGQVYLHQSLQPLDEVDLSTPEDRGQASLWDAECTGHCGV